MIYSGTMQDLSELTITETETEVSTDILIETRLRFGGIATIDSPVCVFPNRPISVLDSDRFGSPCYPGASLDPESSLGIWDRHADPTEKQAIDATRPFSSVA